TGAEDLRNRAPLEPYARGMNRSEIFGFPEDRDEALGLASRIRNLAELVKDDPPAYDREEKQQGQDSLHERACAENQIRHSHPAPAKLVKHRPCSAPKR